MTDVVVLGAGAAGLMCAATAAAWGASVVVLEHNNVPGKKIRISGGGRCNFTNRMVTANNFISGNPDFARSALSRYTPADFIALVERYGIAWHEKTLGQLFCDHSAQQIIDMLVSECTQHRVELHTGVSVKSVTKSSTFTVQTSTVSYEARCVVLATGGLSIPKLGATNIAYRIAQHFDVPVVQTAPALVPLTCDNDFAQEFADLAGVSLPCNVEAHGAKFSEAMLFTHRGLSGPAMLQISSYLDATDVVAINLFPKGIPQALRDVEQADKRQLKTILSTVLPTRLATAWPDARMIQPRNSMPSKDYLEFLEHLSRWKVKVVGNEGYAKAEVTRGGVDTRYCSSKTMEVTSVPGLYAIGECVDVTGWLGGYNFQWAWASGHAAGTAIRDRIAASI